MRGPSVAHHLAELITTAQTAKGEVKRVAEGHAADPILKLWTNRRALLAPADPLHGHLPAIKVLSAMLPTGDPWRRFQHAGNDDALLGDMFGALVQLVMSGLLLARSGEMRRISDVEWDALSEEEQFLVDILNRWRHFFVTPAPEKISLESFYATFRKSDDDSDTETGASDSEAAEAPEPDPEREQRAAILAHLETFQARLADLIERWRAAGGLDGHHEASDDND